MNVRFCEKPEIHYLYKWSFAYREARKSSYISAACDRQRFEKKILLLSKILNPVLEKKLTQIALEV